MKGRVLGFSAEAGTGAISADDGRRYTFAIADWQAGQPVQTGMRVDFEANGEIARGIYHDTGAAAIDMGALAASPAVGKAKALLTGTIAVPIAIVVLIACVLPVLSIPQKSVSLFDLPSIMAMLNPLDPLGMSGEGGPSGGLTLLLMLRFAAPILALVLIWRAWQGGALRLLTLATGAAAILAFALVMLVKLGVTSQNGELGAAIGSMLGTGIGAWLLLLSGIGLILAGLGKIGRPVGGNS
jgi:hypothetical protein